MFGEDGASSLAGEQRLTGRRVLRQPTKVMRSAPGVTLDHGGDALAHG